jgi:LPS O-antigen subunit length determinant protein (WzzB/FepE family)
MNLITKPLKKHKISYFKKVMKKNNYYLADDELNLVIPIMALWKEKILILSISLICGLLGYIYASFQPQKFKTEITIQNPPKELFEHYSFITNKKEDKNFIYNFRLNFLSPDNLIIFAGKSGGLDDFKIYLKSRNITVEKYFTSNKFGEIKQANILIPNKYFLVFTEDLDGVVFFNNYAEFIKEKSIIQFKKNLKLSIENRVYIFEKALELANAIQLENPITTLTFPLQAEIEQENLFYLSYKGSKILSSEILYLKKILTKLENDQFNYNLILDKESNLSNISRSSFIYSLWGLAFGLLLSFVIIFFKSGLKNK